MDTNNAISQAILKQLGGDYGLETRINYAQYDVDSKPDAGFTLVVKNPLIESDPDTARKQILAALGKLDPLRPYVKTESETNHMERLAKELEFFRDAELQLNKTLTGTSTTTIHNKAPDWFRELPKRNNWNIKHALNVSKEDTGIVKVRIDIPKDIAPEEIVKNIEGRKEAILDMLARRTSKYTPEAATPEQKEALQQKVKNLEMNVLAQTNADESKSVYIYLMSKEQLAATKLPGGITADKVAGLNATNPLLALQNGESDQHEDKAKPQPHLQKALARSILFAGDKHEEIIPYIAGKEDMRRMVGKSLTNLKNYSAGNPSLVKRIDEFLADSVFKDSNQWGKPLEQMEDVAIAPTFNKITGIVNDTPAAYEPGVMTVQVHLPADKFPAIRDQLAALGGAPATTPALTDDAALAQAIQQEIKPLVEVMVGVINNQKDLATVVQETQQIQKSWVERVEAGTKAPQAAPATSADEMLANAVLAAAQSQAAPNASLLAAAGPKSLISRTEKTASEPQHTLGA